MAPNKAGNALGALDGVDARALDGVDARALDGVDSAEALKRLQLDMSDIKSKMLDGVDSKAAKANPDGMSNLKKGGIIAGVGLGAALIGEGIISSEAAAKCLDDCLPTNYNKSEESGFGSLSRDEMEYQTGDGARCDADIADCAEYCAAECKVDSWAEKIGELTGKVAGTAGKAAGETAGDITKGFLGGLGIGPIMIAVICIIIIIVAITML
jgi:tetrahydromethanopterin S-methyltransferase subunit G